MEFESRWFIPVLSLLAAFCCYIPIISDLDVIELEHTQQSETFERIIVGSCSIAFPLLLDAIMNFDLPKEFVISRWLFLLSLIVPNVVMLASGRGNTLEVKYIICSSFCREMLVVGGFVNCLYCKTHFLEMCRKFFFVTVAITMILDSNFYFVADGQRPILKILIIVFGTISYFGIACFSLAYLWELYRQKASLNSVEKYCGVLALLLFCSQIVRIIFQFPIVTYSASNSNHKCLVETIAAVFGFILPSRIAIENAALSHVLLTTKKNFVRYVSHEIRTPLNTVLMGIDLLISHSFIKDATTSDSDDVREILNDMNLSCDSAIDTLNDLLLFEKIEDGKMKLEKKNILIPELVQKCVKPFDLQARCKNITLRYEGIDPTSSLIHSSVHVDTNKIAQVFRNLISNALKFTPKSGNVTVRAYRIGRNPVVLGPPDGNSPRFSRNTVSLDDPVESWIQCDNGSRVRFEVQDTGTGIAPDDLKKMFTQFTQFNAGELQAGKGSGLGLWISRNIVHSHGGHIDVISEYGVGSTFFFDLDLNLDLENDNLVEKKIYPTEKDLISAPELDSPTQITAVSQSLRFTRALIVDDSQVNRKLMRKLLGTYFESIDEAEDGREAVRLVEQSSIHGEDSYEIIFMDYVMPNLSGPEATELIRGLGFDSPIIGVTGNAYEEAKVSFLNAGATAVLVKPVNMNTLTNILNKTQRSSLESSMV